MNNSIIALLLLISLGCSNRPSDVANKDSNDSTTTTKISPPDSLTVGQINYKKSLIYREFENDSLLLDLPDLKRLIRSFTSKSKVKEKEYGAGDYFGKYRVYADKLDTLIIDKGDGGDYGFGNTVYLKRDDSIVLYRNYEFNSIVSESGQTEEITEQLIAFKQGTMSAKQRKMTTKDWSELNFKGIKFETVADDPSKRYKSLTDELKSLYKRELIE